MIQPSPKRMAMSKVVRYGAIAGFIATWTISTAVAGSELELGLPIGTFYSIIGISLGLNGIMAAYFGFGLHILAGTILGAVIGTIAIRLSLRSMLNPRKGTLIGIGSGVAVWLILFLPITALLVQPAVNDIVMLSAIESKHAVFSVDVNQSIRNIALSAIVFHLVWGAIFGFILSSLVRTASTQGSIWHGLFGVKDRKENTVR
ncbi:MAG TPA: hypothetical protein VF233_12640 [Nitrososphaeraceae archaeon]